ncbi:hypothetical protein PT274_00945 [Leuconostocaceae bacterium ESL0958]|nr:hypothetical protein [Leuconostocaceae bacterium ESL0958]
MAFKEFFHYCRQLWQQNKRFKQEKQVVQAALADSKQDIAELKRHAARTKVANQPYLDKIQEKIAKIKQG